MSNLINSKTKYELTILIPVFNEEKTVKKILSRVAELPIDKYEVIIVNDASIDSSGNIIKDYIKQNKQKNVEFLYFEHEQNMGKGAGIQTGIKHARGNYFVIQDADLEYHPKDLINLLRTAQTSNYDAIYGSRFTGKIKNMAKANYMANLFYNWLLNIMYGTKITDMHTCYKMVRTSLLKKLKISSNGFDYATELISKLLKNNIEVHELPIKFKGRTKKEGKKIDVMDGIECTYKLLRFRFSNSDSLFSERSTTFARFMVVGLAGFLANYVILVFLTQIAKLDHIVAEIIAAVIALQITFILHDRWTYLLHTPKGTERLKIKARYISYMFSNAFGSFITIILFSLLYNHLFRLPSLIIAASVGVFWNYLSNTYIIWSKEKPKS